MSMKRRIKEEGDLPPDEKRFALLALDHQKTVAGSELRWVESTLKDLLQAENTTTVTRKRARKH
jgi:hypothetical protein